MSTLLKINDLEELLKKKKKHDVGKAMDILPYTVHSSNTLKGNINGILGDYVRNICGLQLANKKKKENIYDSDNYLINQIMDAIECNEDAKYDLERFLNQYLFGKNNSIKPIHPYLFNYMSAPESKEKENQKYAQFMRDILVYGGIDISSVFNNKESEDILTELILSKLDVSSKDISIQYQPLMEFLANLYQEDLKFLSESKDYFLKSFSLLTQFYSFMYVCQLVMKFEQFDVADYSNATPLYFALEWESISKRRKAADSLEGFRRVKEKAPNLFVHIHTMSQLSHNELQSCDEVESKNKIRFMTYTELKELMDSKGEDTSERLVNDINEWVHRYSHIETWKDSVTPKEESKDLPQAFRTLFNCLQEGMSTGSCEKFGKNIEDLGVNVFLKNRGSIGAVFNMSHEMLLLLTAVCVKEERMPLNRLFEEFSKRGVAFDRHSKKMIIELFDSHNILDKKSDSGDAQYVKRIL
ncbi:DNA phosphorothioation-dependent restriction protein DptG [Bacillus wiedmannii]|uniref:DNA phosphorothioation-dependent restriction protein DptG n=1 Tax=Bacillus wiedmannii TaxID=1890302 RepID=UPI000BED6491|nr:DNA phosphorothioation-dependent restriction protein DptG [Bacillus wiedmannii]PEA78243.1 DNA phosphorothioation-dependent restriction protein DptG [Bacillus wiedmannii]